MIRRPQRLFDSEIQHAIIVLSLAGKLRSRGVAVDTRCPADDGDSGGAEHARRRRFGASRAGLKLWRTPAIDLSFRCHFTLSRGYRRRDEEGEGETTTAAEFQRPLDAVRLPRVSSTLATDRPCRPIGDRWAAGRPSRVAWKWRRQPLKKWNRHRKPRRALLDRGLVKGSRQPKLAHSCEDRRRQRQSGRAAAPCTTPVFACHLNQGISAPIHRCDFRLVCA